MKKSILVGLMAMLILLLSATAASASVAYYHGDFDNNSSGCAQCHVTHAGSWKALLIGGTNQTEFCYLCHNSLSKSPYDVKDGIIATTTGELPSLAGGFDKSFNFDVKTYNATDGAFTNLSDANFYPISTSMHGVQGYDTNVWLTGALIPGGTSTLTGDFRCGSCHNPHEGGDYDGNVNLMPRLLKKDLPKQTFLAADFRDWSFSTVGDAKTTGYQTRTVQGYGDDVGLWCAGCHDLFNQTAHNAGQNPVNNASTENTDKYMHRMNFVVATGANGQDAIVNKSIDKLALSVGGELTCLTCHRAHGTASETSDGVARLNYNRANSTYLGTTGGQNNSTVLLREENRDVCFHCHGAAQYNKPSQQGS